MDDPKRYVMIACAVLTRECYYCAAMSRNVVDIRFLAQGLHDIGESKMSAKLQAEIDSVPAGEYDAILLGYGLCSNGIRGLRAPLPLVAPRAHDCITLLMGSKEAYQAYFDRNPGTFYQSVGWIERARSNLSNPESTTRQMGMSSYEEYVKQYGEENAKYLVEVLGGFKHYDRLAYIDTEVGDSGAYRDCTREQADKRGWRFDLLKGSTTLLWRMMQGEWDEEDFLVVAPGQAIAPSYDGSIVRSEECPESNKPDAGDGK